MDAVHHSTAALVSYHKTHLSCVLKRAVFEVLASIKKHSLYPGFKSSNIFHHTNVNRESVPKMRAIILKYSLAIFSIKIEFSARESLRVDH